MAELFPNHPYKIVTPADMPDVVALLEKQTDPVSADTETTGLDPTVDTIRLLTLYLGEGPVFVFDWRRLDESDLAPLLDWLADESGPPVFFHNASFDCAMLWGSAGCVIHRRRLRCTMLSERLLTSGRLQPVFKGRPQPNSTEEVIEALHETDREDLEDQTFTELRVSLAETVKRRLDKAMPKDLQRSDWTAPTLSAEQIQYAANDAVAVHLLQVEHETQLRLAELTRVAELEWECCWAFVWQRLNGLPISEPDLQAAISECVQEEAALSAKLLETVDAELRARGHRGLQRDLYGDIDRDAANFRSSKVKATLFPLLGVEVDDYKKETIFRQADNSNPSVAAFVEWASCSALLTRLRKLPTYVNSLTGRLHPGISQLQAPTGRVSAREPNTTSIPRSPSVRRLFKAEDGFKFVVGDFPNIEPRIVALVSGDSALQKVFMDGIDPYKAVASVLYNVPVEKVDKTLRNKAKPILLGLIYAMSAKTLRRQATYTYKIEMSEPEAVAARTAFFRAYPQLQAWHNKLSDELRSSSGGTKVPSVSCRTLLGRRRILQQNSLTLNTRANTPIQGTGADIAKASICRLVDLLEEAGLLEDVEMVNFIHDEICLIAPDHLADAAAKTLARAMQEAAEEIIHPLPCPIDVGIGQSWQEAKV